MSIEVCDVNGTVHKFEDDNFKFKADGNFCIVHEDKNSPFGDSHVAAFRDYVYVKDNSLLKTERCTKEGCTNWRGLVDGRCSFHRNVAVQFETEIDK